MYLSGLSASNNVRRIIFENNDDGSVVEFPSSAIDRQSPSGSQLFLTIGAGELTPGSYDIIVEALNDPDGCSGRLQDGIVVVNTTTLNILSTDPQYAWVNQPLIPITIRASGGLEDTPTVYISSPDGGDAFPLAAVQFVDENTLTAVVENEGPLLMPGAYDIIVINPRTDKSTSPAVGVLRGFFTITSSPPPRVLQISPDAYRSGDTAALLGVTITGANFNNSVVTLNCIDANGVSLGIRSTSSNVVVSSTEITVDIPDLSIFGSPFCSVIVTNGDGVFVVFSGIDFKPANNDPIAPIVQAATLLTPRRQAAVVVGQVTAASRIVYVIGGDEQNSSGYVADVPALDSVEYGVVDELGRIASMSELGTVLPTPCTYSDATPIGRYLYLMCGHNGTSPVSSIYRAEVLSPLAAPRIDLLLDVAEAGANDTSIFRDGGSWQYRVSAVFAPNDSFNPDGESLPGEPLNVKLPAVQEGYFEVLPSFSPSLPDS